MTFSHSLKGKIHAGAINLSFRYKILALVLATIIFLGMAMALQTRAVLVTSLGQQLDQRLQQGGKSKGHSGGNFGGRNKSLTPRETEVLRLVALGYTNHEIAAALGLSVKTVETHKGNISRKLNLTSRAELVHYALQQGLIPRD
ncbi:helix-turn-helix transcriptional regulator [Moorella sp. Hama-1]|uniref:helix-turn-helix transcriptional regulator n=1 Tax=Moorella sp. Hama-1 TaxID=2138101 RepID=UPI000D65D9B4|nr:response regulator transcription factor [Moorella sp. Hama-1]BCV22797.1 hypothetical protein hamaS1_28660 [Moorella sp. Hama-1]